MQKEEWKRVDPKRRPIVDPADGHIYRSYTWKLYAAGVAAYVFQVNQALSRFVCPSRRFYLMKMGRLWRTRTSFISDVPVRVVALDAVGYSLGAKVGIVGNDTVDFSQHLVLFRLPLALVHH